MEQFFGEIFGKIRKRMEFGGYWGSSVEMSGQWRVVKC